MPGEYEPASPQQPVNLQPMSGGQTPTPICIGAPVISGTGSEEVLERVVLDVAALTAAAVAAGLLPAGVLFRAAEVVVLSKRVTVEECEVFTNKVLVNGVLHKDLLFKFVSVTAGLTTGVITTGDCTLLLSRTVDIVLDCPFGACIEVLGACPGDECEIINACVEAERDLLIDVTGTGIPSLFEEKVCLLIQAKTVRQTLITITPTLPNICPTFPTAPPCPTPICPTSVGLPTSVFVTRRAGSIMG